MAVRTIGRLAPSSAALFVCDIQERFVPLITGMPNVIDTAKRMVRGAQALGVPVLATEQYPKALGPTVPELKELLGPTPTIVSKTLFSMVTPEVEEWLKSKPDVKQVLLLGIETHVCVLQTSLDLLAKGYEVHLIVDGVSSQRAHDRAVGLQRISQSGGFLTSSEMVLFQMAKDAKNPAFKAISNLAKEARLEPIPFTAML